MRFCILISTWFFLITTLSTMPVMAGNQLLQEGIRQYNLENYEEAADILEKEKSLNPGSSEAAFYLGMAYKQMMNYPAALENFRAAVSREIKIKEGLVELIDVLQRIGTSKHLAEARHWIAIAEDARISPAKISFLKGLILNKQGRGEEAIAAFEKAAEREPGFTQAAEFQIALTLTREKKLETARQRFNKAILADPQSDLAAFARQYQDSVSQALDQVWRFTLGAFGQYNTNLIAKPADSSFSGTMDDERSFTFAPTFKLNYTPFFNSDWMFNLQYSFSGSFNQRHSTRQDVLTNSISLNPGYNFGLFSVSLPILYSHNTKKDPTFDHYSDWTSVGPLVRMAFGGEHMAEAFVGYDRKEYFKPASLSAEDRDSTGLTSYLSWIWLFDKDAFFNLKAEYLFEDTEGDWWENHGYRGSANLAYPLGDSLQLQVSALLFIQNYVNDHPLVVPTDPRKDRTYQGSLGLNYTVMENASLILQYAYTRVDSNIGFYDYDRNLYTAGVEYRF